MRTSTNFHSVDRKKIVEYVCTKLTMICSFRDSNLHILKNFAKTNRMAKINAHEKNILKKFPEKLNPKCFVVIHPVYITEYSESFVLDFSAHANRYQEKVRKIVYGRGTPLIFICDGR